MESNRIVGIALESPVSWVRVTIPAHEPCTLPFPAALTDSTPRSLLFVRHGVQSEERVVHWVCPHDASIEEWISPARWSPNANVRLERSAALITIVGESAWVNGDVTAQAESALELAGIPIWSIQSGAHSLSILIPGAEGERASRLLHDALL